MERDSWQWLSLDERIESSTGGANKDASDGEFAVDIKCDITLEGDETANWDPLWLPMLDDWEVRCLYVVCEWGWWWCWGCRGVVGGVSGSVDVLLEDDELLGSCKWITSLFWTLVFITFLVFSKFTEFLLLNVPVTTEEPNTSQLGMFDVQLGFKVDVLKVDVDFTVCQ